MKIEMFCVGRTRDQLIAKAIQRYADRIGHYIGFSLRIFPDVKSSSKMTEAMQKDREGAAFLAAIQPADFVVLLDERGRELTSREFADLINRHANSGLKRLIFVVGGPYGFAPDVYARANAKLSLSRMTFPHEMVRLFFVEQIYRAMTILRGEPYHHD